MGKNFRSYLLDLRNTSTPFKGVRKALIDTLLDGYETAPYGTGVFGLSEYLRYQEALSELATVVKAQSGSSQRQHQSAAKDLSLLKSPQQPSRWHTSPPVRRVNVPSTSSNWRALRTTITHWRVLCDGAEGLSLLMEPDRLQCACWVALTQVIWFSPALDQLKPWLCSELLRFHA